MSPSIARRKSHGNVVREHRRLASRRMGSALFTEAGAVVQIGGGSNCFEANSFPGQILGGYRPSAYFHKFAYLKRPFPKDHAAICLAWK